MKRLISLILVLLLTLFLLEGCGDSGTVAEVPRDDSGAAAPDGKSIAQFVSSQYSGVFAVLYEDGTVGVGGEIYYGEDSGTDLLEVYKPALEWKNVKKIYLNVGCLFALHEDGTVSFVNNSQESPFEARFIDTLTGVADIAFLEPNGFAFFLMEDGTVKFDGYEDPSMMSCEGWRNVKKLVSYYYVDLFAICDDGTVKSLCGSLQEPIFSGTPLRDFYTDCAKYYGLAEDGSIKLYHGDPEYSLIIPNETITLEGIQSLFPVSDLMFGLTQEGELRVSGGEEWFCEEYARRYDRYPVSFSEFTDVRQIDAHSYYGLPFLTALREDGTLVAMDPEINERLASYEDIVKVVVGANEYSGTTLICGLQSDGNVVALEIYASGDVAIHSENYAGWKAKDLFRMEDGVIIAFCEDGSILTNAESSNSLFRYMPPAGYGK